MKNKIQLSILIIGLILLLFAGGVQMANASYTYERTPSGSQIPSPVSFEIICDDVIADLELDASTTHWGFFINNNTDGFSNYPDCDEVDTIFTEYIPVSTKSNTFVIDICVGFGSDEIGSTGCIGTGCADSPDYEGVILENGTHLFTIYKGNIITITSQSVASITAYIGNLFSDLGPFIWLAIGLPLGFWVIKKTIGLVRARARN